MRSGWLRCVVVVLSLVFVLSCGSSSKSALVYLVSQGTSPGTVTAYSLNLSSGILNSTNGALTQTGKSVNTGVQPTVLLFDPTRSFAYTANVGDNPPDITTLTVNKDGSLTAGGSVTPLTHALRPSGLAMDPGAHFLFVSNQGDGTAANPGNLSVFSIGSGGALSEVTGSPFAIRETSPPLPFGFVPPLASSVAVSNKGNFVYVTDQANNAVASFSFDTTSGALTPISGTCAPPGACLGVVVGTGPSAIFSPPVGNFLYVANASSNDIYEFMINTDGTLSPITATSTTVATGLGPIAMITDPNAKYFYALANQGSQIMGYTLNHVTGELTTISANGGTVSTGSNPVAFVIRSDGNTNGNFWIVTSNNGASSVSTYSLEYTTGRLTALPQLTSPLAPYGIGSR